MSGTMKYDELLDILKGMRKYINKPKKSGKAGELIPLIKRIDKALKKHEKELKKNEN